jgi:AntA/AntB antirepressor
MRFAPASKGAKTQKAPSIAKDQGCNCLPEVNDSIQQFGFVEGVEFVTDEILSSPNLGSAKSRPQKMVEYHVALDMAKELAMVERNGSA